MALSFGLLLLGDFSGRGWHGTGTATALDTRRIIRVDLDNLDEVCARLKPSCPLVLDGGAPAELTVSAVDDFHPDQLLQRQSFRHLVELRARLQDPSQFEDAAAEVTRSLLPVGAAGAADTSPSDPAESDAGLLDRLLGQSPGEVDTGTQAVHDPLNLEAFVRAVVAPHVVSDTAAPRRAAYVSAVDAAISERLRACLHSPPFQSLEANWRGVRWLLSNLDLDEDLQIHLLDITQAELLADARAFHADVHTSALWRRLVDRPAAGGDALQWGAIVTLFEVGADRNDLTWLTAVGGIGAEAGVPTLATAGPSLLGLQRYSDMPDPREWPDVQGAGATLWQAVRQSAIAPWIGLAAPRLLLRQPYGAATDPVEDLATFEECAGASEHEQLSWAPAALGCALLLAQAFREREWEMQPGDVQQISDLPAYVVERDGERRLQPCAEVLLSERAALAMLERGIMPLASYKDRAEVRLVRFQSVADPSGSLSGPWS